MSHGSQAQIEEFERAENAEKRKLEGYRKKLEMEGTLSELTCHDCEGPLSVEDAKKDQCLHCGYEHFWNRHKYKND